MSTKTVSVADARANFSKLGEKIVLSGESITVFKHSKPWLIISPATPIDEPNKDTLTAAREADEILADPSRQRFDGFEDMMSALRREANA